MDMREMIREFNVAFGRPMNTELTELSLEDRILLGSLLLEETVEYITKGLGLAIEAKDMMNWSESQFTVVPRPGHDPGVDPVECADGLGDVNVIIHFNSHWQGFNLDAVTAAIHESNMSKLGADGKAIINGLTPGYRQSDKDADGAFWCDIRDPDEPGYDPTRPMGKILKGPNYQPVNLRPIIEAGNA